MIHTSRMASLAAGVGVAALAAALYLRHLDAAPMSTSELALAHAAHSVTADDGRDTAGRVFPMYWRGEQGSFTPIPLYASALAIGFVGPDGGSRIASASFAVVGVLLFFALVQRTFHSIGLAVSAAILLSLTPSYAAAARTATHDGIWLVPIVMAWLLALQAALRRPRAKSRWPIVFCVLAVTSGVYAQPSGAWTIVVLAIVSAAALWPAGHLTLRALAYSVGAALLVALPFVIWLARYPSAYAETFGAWVLHPALVRNPLALAPAVTNSNTLSTVAKVYWDFFSPSHLLIGSETPAMAGAFALPVGVLIAFGVRTVWPSEHADRVSPVRFALLGVATFSTLAATGGQLNGMLSAVAIVPLATLCAAGVLVATGLQDTFGRRTLEPSHAVARAALLAGIAVPLVAATFQEPRAMQRAVTLVPLAMLLATHGVHALWQAGARGRVVAVLAIVAALMQSIAWYAATTSF